MRDNLFALVTMKKGTKYILVKKKKNKISFTYTTMRKNKMVCVRGKGED